MASGARVPGYVPLSKRRTVKTARLARIKDAGIGTALADAKRVVKCAARHATWHAKQGYKFCPVCGVSLIPVIQCKDCHRNFTSFDNYELHKKAHTIKKNFPSNCPTCQADDVCIERVKFGANRDTFECRRCNGTFHWHPISNKTEAANV